MLFPSSFLRLLCLGAILMTASSESCWTCNPTDSCLTCVDKIDNGDGTETVTLDFSGCKGSDISWACCVSSSGGNGDGSCVVADDGCVNRASTTSDSGNGHKCETVSTMKIEVPTGATKVLINTHDGQTYGGTALENVNTGICGGTANEGGGCAKKLGGSSYCAKEIDISQCGHESTCVEGKPCRAKANACDTEEVCTDGKCPCDTITTGGYVFKCSTTAFLCNVPDLAAFPCNNGDRGVDFASKLKYPDCLGYGHIQLAQLCPNQRDISNFASGYCKDVDNKPVWICFDEDKIEFDATYIGGYPFEAELMTVTDQCLADLKIEVLETLPVTKTTGKNGHRRLGGSALW